MGACACLPMDLILPGWLGSSTTLHSPTPTVRVCAILSTALGPHEAWLLATCGGVIWHQESATATLRRFWYRNRHRQSQNRWPSSSSNSSVLVQDGEGESDGAGEGEDEGRGDGDEFSLFTIKNHFLSY